MKTLRERLNEISLLEVLQPEDNLTPLERLKKSNEERREALDEKKDNLDFKKSMRGVAGIAASPYLQATTNIGMGAVAGNTIDKGTKIITPGEDVINYSGYKKFKL